jgi:hemolysin activation/secretion protein
MRPTLRLSPPFPVRWTAALGSLALSWSAAAQTPPDAGRLLEQTRPAPRPEVPQQPPRLIEAPVRPTVNMPEGLSVLVTDFRITGAQSFPAEKLAELVKPFVGRRLDINGLNEAAGAITRHYQAAGHLLSYAYLPAQRVADGTIEIAVLEGRLEGVQVVAAQDVRLRDEVVQAHTDRLAAQPPLLQADVERQMLLLNDIPGVVARAAFTPGSSTGSAELVVSVAEDEPLQVRADINNHGSPSSGTYRAGLSVQLRDLFGWGDSSYARGMVSNRGSLVSGSLGTQVPLGGDGWKIGASVSRLSYQLAGKFSYLNATGSADTAGVDASYPLLRSQAANINLRGAFEHKRLGDEIGLVGTSNPKRNDTFEATASFDVRDPWGATAGSVTAHGGDLHILDEATRIADANGLQTDRRYHKLGLQLLRQQQLAGPWSVYARVAGQVTGGNLDSSEKMSLAGPTAVRAYGPGEASVDQGVVATLELRYAHDYLGGNATWGLFYDQAQGRINRRPLVASGNEPKLAGAGLSVQWSSGDIGIGASLALRTSSRVPTAEGGDPKPRVYFQLSVTP